MTNTTREHRFSAWVSLLAFSIFCLASNLNVAEPERVFFTEIRQQEPDPKTPKRKWVTAVTSISTAISLASILAHLFYKNKFVGTKIELAACISLIIFWAAGLPVIMNPNNEIAQAGLFIIDYNLYFFSWLAFDTALLIFGGIKEVPRNVSLWSAMAFCSIIVVGSSTRLYRDSTCTGGRFEVDCERTKWAIGFGAACTAIGIIMVFLVSREVIGMWIETGVATLVMIVYALGVGFLTYGDGPGLLVLGNMYFFTWAGFLVALLLSSDLFYEALQQSSRDKEDSGKQEEQKAKDDVPEAAKEKEDSSPNMEEGNDVEVTTAGVEDVTTNV